VACREDVSSALGGGRTSFEKGALEGKDVSRRPGQTRAFVSVRRGNDPDLASYLRIEEREPEAGGDRTGEPEPAAAVTRSLGTGRRRSACAPLSPAQGVESAPRLLCGARAEVGSEPTGEPTLGRMQLASDT
jgi:hypothetical protein